MLSNMATPEVERKPAASGNAGGPGNAPVAAAPTAVSALSARELPSAVNSEELMQEHFSRTGGKVWES